MSTQRYKTNLPKVISETIDGETIIINLDSGHYFSLNRSGGEIWNAVVNRCTVDEIAQGLASRYAADAAAIPGAVREFLQSLLKENLISVADAADAGPSDFVPQTGAPPTFETPAFQRYDDMQDLLLLDPIHDVDESGWPKTAPQAS